MFKRSEFPNETCPETSVADNTICMPMAQIFTTTTSKKVSAEWSNTETPPRVDEGMCLQEESELELLATENSGVRKCVRWSPVYAHMRQVAIEGGWRRTVYLSEPRFN